MDSANNNPTGITWDGTYLRVTQLGVTDKVFTYTTSGTHVSAQDFNLDSANNNPTGITWDGTYLRVTQGGSGGSVYTYRTDGTHVSGEDFNISLGIRGGSGITSGGDSFYVVSHTSNPSLGSDGYVFSADGAYRDITFEIGSNSDILRISGVTLVGSFLAVVGTTEDRVYYYDFDDVYTGVSSIPAAPDLVEASRNDDYDQVTVTWDLDDTSVEFQIQRLEATTVAAGEQIRIEYGNAVTFTESTGLRGLDEYVDDTVDPSTTYQYRVRAKGANYGPWSAYAFSGAEPRPDQLDAPTNVEVARATGNDQVTVIWTAPPGDVQGYFVQRQELVESGGSTFFANTVTLNDPALSSATLTYTDTAILPGRIYEYRVAAVKDDLVGEYSDWARSGAVNRSLGNAPANFRLSEHTERDDRLEYWLEWDAADGADEYEINVRYHDALTGVATAVSPSPVVTETAYFYTAYGRAEFQVRSRMIDEALCGSGIDDRCVSHWTGWLDVGFVPPVVDVELPNVLETPPTPPPEAVALREDVIEVVEASLDPVGLPYDAGLFVDMMVVVGGAVLFGIAYLVGASRGVNQPAIGVGMGAVLYVLVLSVGVTLLETPLPWLVAGLTILILGGGLAVGRITGVLGDRAG
ncbi:MAG: fibronectin type III domain-containing protein [Chloroflexota bacterium]|nr:fibronectin type III domain-containing protein [Chloroflexota bacterium]